MNLGCIGADVDAWARPTGAIFVRALWYWA
jgi:hypothetical protein